MQNKIPILINHNIGNLSNFFKELSINTKFIKHESQMHDT